MKRLFSLRYPLFFGLAGALAFWAWRPEVGAQAAQPVPVLSPAPELAGNSWLNTAQGAPLSLAARRGKVTVVEFWAFRSPGSRANLPVYARWQEQFRARGVQVVGVHTPELAEERDPQNAARAVRELGITYPVLLDQRGQNGKLWQLRARPTIYLIDKKGRIRYRWEGQLQSGGAGGAAKMTQRINDLLNETESAGRVEKTDAQWRAELSPEAYEVLRRHGTEAAFTGALWDNHEKGIYRCAGCGQELFDSATKFESGTGWPSFYQPVTRGAVEEKRDTSYGMVRVEILCSRCEGHLGHVFNDGPKPTGLRYCMNSAALSFEKKE